MKVIFDHKRAEAADITTFYFRPEDKFDYTAGQYVEVILKHSQAGPSGDKRLFTLSSSPTDELLSITSRFYSKDSHFKKYLSGLKPGDSLAINGPFGNFVLPTLVQTPLIFVAGGIGITPFNSMLKWLAATGEKRPIKLLYAVNTEDDIIFQQTFQKAHQGVTFVVNQPSASWGGERGYLTAELILGLEKPSDDTLIYISGPEGMVESLRHDLLKAGVKQHQLVLDFFEGYNSF